MKMTGYHKEVAIRFQEQHYTSKIYSTLPLFSGQHQLLRVKWTRVLANWSLGRTVACCRLSILDGERHKERLLKVDKDKVK